MISPLLLCTEHGIGLGGRIMANRQAVILENAAKNEQYAGRAMLIRFHTQERHFYKGLRNLTAEYWAAFTDDISCNSTKKKC